MVFFIVLLLLLVVAFALRSLPRSPTTAPTRQSASPPPTSHTDTPFPNERAFRRNGADSSGRTIRLRQKPDADLAEREDRDARESRPSSPFDSLATDPPLNQRQGHLGPEKSDSQHPDVFVFDTSALMHRPQILCNRPGSTLVVPSTVFNELCSIKENRNKSAGERFQAQCVFRVLERITGHDPDRRRPGRFYRPDGGVLIMFADDFATVPRHLDPRQPDNVILSIALHFWGLRNNVWLISEDKGQRIACRASGVECLSEADF